MSNKLYVWRCPNYHTGSVVVIASSLKEAKEMVIKEDEKDLAGNNAYWRKRRKQLLSDKRVIISSLDKKVVSIYWGNGL